MRGVAVLLAVLLAAPMPAAAQSARTITLATTTSVENSGLLQRLLPLFEAETGSRVHVVAQGTGRALRTARNGDADAVLVHHPALEEAFVADGFGVERRPLMHNHYGIVGPATDPAGIADAGDAVEAFRRIYAAGAGAGAGAGDGAGGSVRFISRGDDSGTHNREREIWRQAGVDPLPDSGSWYLEAGAGMGATLNMSGETDAYTLTDRGTWLTFGNKGSLRWLSEDTDDLRNCYAVILVNPARHGHVAIDAARRLSDWLASPAATAVIADFTVEGQPAFTPGGEGCP